MCDSLMTELEKRKCAHDSLELIFRFMCNENLSDVCIKERAKKFQEFYA